MKGPTNITPSDIGLYYIARITCVECGLFEQNSCKTMKESEAMMHHALDRIGRPDLYE